VQLRSTLGVVVISATNARPHRLDGLVFSERMPFEDGAEQIEYPLPASVSLGGCASSLSARRKAEPMRVGSACAFLEQYQAVQAITEPAAAS